MAERRPKRSTRNEVSYVEKRHIAPRRDTELLSLLKDSERGATLLELAGDSPDATTLAVLRPILKKLLRSGRVRRRWASLPTGGEGIRHELHKRLLEAMQVQEPADSPWNHVPTSAHATPAEEWRAAGKAYVSALVEVPFAFWGPSWEQPEHGSRACVGSIHAHRMPDGGGVGGEFEVRFADLVDGYEVNQGGARANST